MKRKWLKTKTKKLAQQSLAERATNGCRNPTSTPNQRFSFALLTSRT